MKAVLNRQVLMRRSVQSWRCWEVFPGLSSYLCAFFQVFKSYMKELIHVCCIWRDSEKFSAQSYFTQRLKWRHTQHLSSFDQIHDLWASSEDLLEGTQNYFSVSVPLQFNEMLAVFPLREEIGFVLVLKTSQVSCSVDCFSFHLKMLGSVMNSGTWARGTI